MKNEKTQIAPAKESKEQKSDTATKKAVVKKVKERMYSQLAISAAPSEQKKFRSKARRAIQKLADACITASLAKEQKGLEAAVKEFNAHYKKEYVTNDFSVKSIFTGKNEEKIKDLGRALKIVKSKLAGK
ncbi:MAG: hypothetical protein IID03_12070 [Candidatus Dadabacteria bacterium]|nr:hypothetical protein [Candidatus Dadabacteria bacterium]